MILNKRPRGTLGIGVYTNGPEIVLLPKTNFSLFKLLMRATQAIEGLGWGGSEGA